MFIEHVFILLFFHFVHFKQHKTTLGEAEIQSAVEAAAVIFKKVVLQRRAAKKANEEGKLISKTIYFYWCNAIDAKRTGEEKLPQKTNPY